MRRHVIVAMAFVLAIAAAPLLHHGSKPLSLTDEALIGSINTKYMTQMPSPQLKPALALAAEPERTPVDTSTPPPKRHTYSHTRGRGKPIPKPKHHHHYTWYTSGASVYDQWSGGVACGFRAPGGMGVAHKSLPCGTQIRFRYHGRKVTAWVIDRGPYVSGREWDLSYEVQNALGFPYGVDYVDWRYIHP